jgi:riboflavin biosynthesis pyrimidine reductase
VVTVDASTLRGADPFDVLVEPSGWPLALPDPFGAMLARHPLPERAGRGARIVSYVVSLDGSIRLSDARPHPSEVALGSLHDLVMLVLSRAVAATIVVGAAPLRLYGNLQDAAALAPALSPDIAALRERLGWGPLHHVVVSGSGDLPAGNPIWSGPASVLTSPAGAHRLAGLGLPPRVEVVVDEQAVDGRVRPAAIAELADRLTPARSPAGAPGIVALEPGPTLFAELLAADLVDELFLTLSPLLTGPAPGRVNVVGAPVTERLSLNGLSRAGSHLFTRWRPAGPLDPTG